MASTKSGLDDHYAPGQYIGRVGSQKVLAERFLGRGETDQALSERHEIYLVTTRIRGVSGRVRRILSRFVAPKESLIAGLRKEEETLKRVGTHPNIDSTFTLLERTRPDGALEILVLKDFYPEGSVWGMLKDSPDHLAEVDILHIFADVCQGVLEMHTLRPPLIHRNIRPANIARRKTSYKLTGLAAAAPVTRVLPSDPQELRALQDDMDKHMSLDYRAPETLDLSQRHPIDEKTDVWALGVLLFELCWSRTPFMHDSSAILSAEYTIPTRQAYSPDLISLLESMLRKDGTSRPTIFEVLAAVHEVRGTQQPYAPRLQPIPARAPRPPATSVNVPSPTISLPPPPAHRHSISVLYEPAAARPLRISIPPPPPPLTASATLRENRSAPPLPAPALPEESPKAKEAARRRPSLRALRSLINGFKSRAPELAHVHESADDESDEQWEVVDTPAPAPVREAASAPPAVRVTRRTQATPAAARRRRAAVTAASRSTLRAPDVETLHSVAGTVASETPSSVFSYKTVRTVVSVKERVHRSHGMI